MRQLRFKFLLIVHWLTLVALSGTISTVRGEITTTKAGHYSIKDITISGKMHGQETQVFRGKKKVWQSGSYIGTRWDVLSLTTAGNLTNTYLAFNGSTEVKEFMADFFLIQLEPAFKILARFNSLPSEGGKLDTNKSGFGIKVAIPFFTPMIDEPEMLEAPITVVELEYENNRFKLNPDKDLSLGAKALMSRAGIKGTASSKTNARAWDLLTRLYLCKGRIATEKLFLQANAKRKDKEQLWWRFTETMKANEPGKSLATLIAATKSAPKKANAKPAPARTK